ncbi:baseplate J/gp47 family protein [Brevibacillus borstelensis]|uniref:baseplate J/gp47 family protein n=1 Tax=Brevibacillus borstelensis TaxID=45462 RepID=UPI0030F56575
MVRWPTKDELTQKFVEYLIGPNKTIDDLQNQWVAKHLILGLREAVYMLVVVLKFVYDNITAVTATGEKLDELGEEYGVERKAASKAIYSVTIGKSSAVTSDTPVPDNFLVTTTPIGNDPPIQYRVIPRQAKVIPYGRTSVDEVLVECTEFGERGNVPEGAINLVAQAGFDFVSNAVVYRAGTNIEEDEVYRQRILDRKRNPGKGGTAHDYKTWAESVNGVVSALVIPLNRGNGTVDIVITGVNGIPDQVVIEECQSFIETKTPAGMADGGVKVLAPTPITINVTLENTIWTAGYSVETGSQFVQSALIDYIERQANKDRVVRVVDLLTTAKQAYNPQDPSKKPVLVDFSMSVPEANKFLANTEMAVVGQITIT